METLVPLKIETTCNTSDTDLIANVEASLLRGTPELTEIEPVNGRSLVLVGSGPSALKYLAQVPTEYDIMAMNGSYRALLTAGYKPKYYAQLDAREDNVIFVRNTPNIGTTFLLASQCHPSMWEALKGQEVRTFHLNTETTRTVTKGKAGMFFGGSGGTIGMTAMALAGALGYRHLILIGYDSSFTPEGQSHLIFQPQNSNQPLLEVWIDDRKYLTSASMAHQVQDYFPWNEVLHQAYPGLAIDILGEGLFYDWIVTNANAPARTRESEVEKYVDAYKLPGYKMPAHRRAAIRDLLSTTEGKSLLDVGTGRGETLREAVDCGYTHVAGTETVPELIVEGIVRGVLPNLPILSKSYDVVTCFEVLEHLLPEDIIPALMELRRIALKTVIVSVCTAPDYVSGVNLHPGAMPETRWVETIQEAFIGCRVEKVGNFSINDVSPVFKITL